MSRGFRASGKNDVWFSLFFIAAVILVGLLSTADETDAPGRPGPVPAAVLKE
ncbi:MAG: hypothetical protein ACT6RD_08465 [Brevundimonas sp.]|uniref:hypothetical protein n=1 Tax=Brevundimonas sp. TaxID=1871086 RepID=UPI0040340531